MGGIGQVQYWSLEIYRKLSTARHACGSTIAYNKAGKSCDSGLCIITYHTDVNVVEVLL